jgi:hypothetical protein
MADDHLGISAEGRIAGRRGSVRGDVTGIDTDSDRGFTEKVTIPVGNVKPEFFARSI